MLSPSFTAPRLVDRAEAWPWCSALKRKQKDRPTWLLPDRQWPVGRPSNWLHLPNEPLAKPDLKQMRTSIERGRPLREDAWMRQTAQALSLDSTLNPQGRPRRGQEDD